MKIPVWGILSGMVATGLFATIPVFMKLQTMGENFDIILLIIFYAWLFGLCFFKAMKP